MSGSGHVANQAGDGVTSAGTSQPAPDRPDEAGGRAPVERDDQLGRRIRQIRTDRGLSLAGLASKVGVTRSFVSSVERGIAYPSVLVLREIAAALDVPVFMLFTGAESTGFVVRPGERKRIQPPSSPISYELLSPDLQRKIEMIIMRLEPGSESVSGAHEGEEVSFLLQGHVVVTVGGIEYELHEGDTIYFASGLPHKVRSLDEAESIMIAAITPPSF
jgi:transcriptional regulator with XRE-family HTH domain